MIAIHSTGPWRVGEMRHKYDIVIRGSDNAPIALVTVAGYLLSEARIGAWRSAWYLKINNKE